MARAARDSMKFEDETSFRELLTHDHARLDAMLGSVLAAVRDNVQPALDEQWAAYEDSLLAHIDAEEMYLLPGLAVHEPRLAARIRDEHAKFRSLLADVGIGLELHTVREEQIGELAQSLRKHAQMEELPLYAWADAQLPKGHFAAFIRRLRATWQRVSSSSAPGPSAKLAASDGREREATWGLSRKF